MAWPDFTDPRIIAFFASFALIFGLAMRFGGWPERIGALVLLAMPLTQLLIYSIFGRPQFDQVDLAALCADAIGLIGFGLIAYFADRDYWPIGAVSMAILSGLSHYARAFSELLPFSYAQYTFVPTAGLILLIMAGTAAHQYRLRRDGEDRDWVPVKKYREFRKLPDQVSDF